MKFQHAQAGRIKGLLCVTRVPRCMHRMRIGAETVLRDKKLSAVLEKAAAGDLKYRLRGAHEVFV